MSNRELDPIEYDYGPRPIPPVQPPAAQPPPVQLPHEPHPPIRPPVRPLPRGMYWQRVRSRLTRMRWPSEDFWIRLVFFMAACTALTAATLVVFEDYVRMYPLGYSGLGSRAFQIGIWLVWGFGIAAIGTNLFKKETG